MNAGDIKPETVNLKSWILKIRCLSSTPAAAPANPRALCTHRPAICSTHYRLLNGSSMYKDEDTYWCTADIGWVTGHSYIVYGPLAQRRYQR